MYDTFSFVVATVMKQKKFLKEVFSPISTKTLELDQIIEVCISYLIIYSIICLFTKKGNSKSSLIRTSKKNVNHHHVHH